MSCSCLGSKREKVKIVENGNWFVHYCSWLKRKRHDTNFCVYMFDTN